MERERHPQNELPSGGHTHVHLQSILEKIHAIDFQNNKFLLSSILCQEFTNRAYGMGLLTNFQPVQLLPQQ